MTKQRQILCNYCGDHTDYVDSSEVYGLSYGMIYLCKPCDAYVGVHKNTDKPLGRLANPELREWKKKVEICQRKDSSYKKHQARGAGYKWLASKLEIDGAHCHIGMFDVEMCQRVVSLVNNKEW